MKFSKKQIIGFVVISLIISAIPPTLYLLKQRQILKSSALEASITCHTEDPAYPDGYEYTSGALDVWVVLADGPGSTNEIGTIPGVRINAVADHLNEPPVGNPNHARTEKDGPGCGFSADGTTDGNGYTHLEPLNCGHNNFAVTASGLPPDVIPVGSTYNNGSLNTVDINNLDLENGTTGVIKLYYYRTQSTPPPPGETPPPPIETPPPPPGETPAPTPAPVCNPDNPGAMVCGSDCGEGGVGSCKQCNGGWCYGGFCKTCSPAATPAPTPAACIGKVCSCSGDAAGSCAQCNGGWCYGGTCKTCAPAAATTPPATAAPLCPIPNAVTNIRISCPYCP